MTEKDPHSSELDGLDPTDLFASVLNSSTPANSSPMILRVSAQGEIRYINTSFASYLGATVEELTGQPIEVAKRLCSPQIAECMDVQTASMAAGDLVTDSTGRVFEPLVSLDAGILDIILTEITPGGDQGSSIVGITEMDENKLKSVRTLETGDISILVLRIHSLDALARSQTRHDLRILLDALEETTNQAVTAYSGAVASAGVGCIFAIFGAPRRFEDHAARAVVAASELRKQLLRMSASFAEDGKSFPKIGLAVWTGEALTGSLGGQRLGAYSAIGTPVQAALELSNLSSEGEILLGEPTLAELIATPPEGWAFQSVQTEAEPDLSYLNWGGSTILPLPEELSCLRCEMVSADSPDGPAHFTFEYLWNLQPAGAEEPSPVVRLLDGEGTSALPLREASSQTQGHALGRYKLLEVLGAGGMGKVWLAKDRFGHPVAIKVLNTHGTPNTEALKRFRREGEIMAKLRHRSICRIYEMNEVDGVSFIAMEYVNGISLSGLLSALPKSTSQKRRMKASASELTDLIRSARHRQSTTQEQPEQTTEDAAATPKAHAGPPLPTEQALTLFSKICEAMQFAHEQGVLHRDLKPANILLREDGEPLVADFGLAKLTDGQEKASLSMTGNVLGTIANMAPEQADSSKHVDERADIYSLGTILYRMLTGHPHFTPTGNIIIDSPKLQGHQPVRPRIHNPAIDADLEIIVLKCLRPEPSRRYRSVRALWTDLDHYRRGEPISARPVSTTELLWKQVLRHKTVSALSATFLLILGVGTIVAFVQITHRAEAAQAAAVEAEAARKKAEENQTLAERREKEAKKFAQAAEASEQETRAALEEVRKAQEKTEQQAKLREQAMAEAAGSKLLLEEVKAGLTAPPSTPIKTKYLPADIKTAEVETGLENALSTFDPRSPNTPDDLYEGLRNVQDNLTRYVLHDPTQGLPLLLLWKMTIFDEEGAHSVIAAMDHQGIEYPGQIEESGTVRDMMHMLNDWAQQGVYRANQFQRIQQAVAHLFPSSEEEPAVKVGKAVVGKIKPSDAHVALTLGAWNPEAIVEYAAANNEVVARGSGVEALGPLLAASGNIKFLDITFSSVKNFPKIEKSIEKITARNSTLTGFDNEAEQYIGPAATLKELDLTGTRLKSVALLRRLPFLKSLFLARTPVPDGSALWQTTETMTMPTHLHSLEELDLSEIPISTFVGIKHLKSLRILRFSPELLGEKDSLKELKGMNLTTISTPKDPIEQSVAEFWTRWETGAYNP